MDKDWRDLVAAAQLRLEACDDPHYDDLTIIKQDVMYNGLLRQISVYSYWNDILRTRLNSPEVILEVAKQLVAKEPKE